MNSWRTTVFGAGGLLTLAFNAATLLLDGDPATNPDWNILIAAAMPAVAALFARDNVVSSENAGAK